MRVYTYRLVVALLVCAGALVGSSFSQVTKATPIAPKELAQRLQAGRAPVILDVRTPAEYAAGHIPGAINIPHTELSQRLGEIPGGKSAEVVVHCQRGGRAATAEETLAGAGYTNVRDLTGHMAAWQQDGLPVEPASAPAPK